MQSTTRSNNVSERDAKAAKRHRAVSGCWHSLATLALVPHQELPGLGRRPRRHALHAIRAAIEDKPWLPPVPAVA
jgi:hypothetical protein